VLVRVALVLVLEVVHQRVEPRDRDPGGDRGEAQLRASYPPARRAGMRRQSLHVCPADYPRRGGDRIGAFDESAGFLAIP
jgi:hypothetical protein